MANNKVAKKEQSSNIVDISLLLEDAETGHNMSNDDMMIPRLRILQDGSPQTKKERANILKVLKQVIYLIVCLEIFMMVKKVSQLSQSVIVQPLGS